MRFILIFLLSGFSLFLSGQIVEADQSGTHAPDFEFTMADGSKKSLSDYKGKVVYLAFWASWCKPCISGFNKYREIRNQMDEIGVVLLNISVDKKTDAWKKAMKALNIQGDHALVDRNDIQDLYQLYSVPRYEIIGKDGEFLFLSDDPGRNVLDNFKAFVVQ